MQCVLTIPLQLPQVVFRRSLLVMAVLNYFNGRRDLAAFHLPAKRGVFDCITLILRLAAWKNQASKGKKEASAMPAEIIS